jgi:1,4-alpha-glucan branching enzyme
MPGDYWQKFANLRLLFSYQICQPGKKLNFMGGGIAQWNEWNLQRELEWHLLDFPIHRSMQTFVKELNFFYRMNSALWERDFDHTGFAWVDFNDTKNSVISYLRKSTTQQLLCVHNFTPETHFDYFLPLQKVAVIREAFNSDLEKYSGSGQQNSNPRIADGQAGLFIKLPPLSTLIFHVHFS